MSDDDWLRAWFLIVLEELNKDPDAGGAFIELEPHVAQAFLREEARAAGLAGGPSLDHAVMTRLGGSEIFGMPLHDVAPGHGSYVRNGKWGYQWVDSPFSGFLSHPEGHDLWGSLESHDVLWDYLLSTGQVDVAAEASPLRPWVCGAVPRMFPEPVQGEEPKPPRLFWWRWPVKFQALAGDIGTHYMQRSDGMKIGPKHPPLPYGLKIGPRYPPHRTGWPF